MRRLSYALAVLTAPVIAAVLAVPAQAAGCPLVADFKGDATVLTLLPASSAVDIVGVDVASGPTTVVAVLHVDTMPTTLQLPTGLLGNEWTVAWSIDGVTYLVDARSPLLFDTFYRATMVRDGVPTGPVSLAVDRTAGTFTWTIPRSYLPELATPGHVFGEIRATTSVLSATSDVAFDWGVTYVDQDPACVTAA